MFFGLSDGLGHNGSNCIGFKRVDGASVGNWKTICKSGGTATELDTGVAGIDDEFQNFAMLVDPIAVRFTIDDITLEPIKTNIPTSILRIVCYVKTTDDH